MDAEHFVAEVQALEGMLYRISVSIVHHSYDAQDAVQQAVINAWAHRGRVEESYFRAWLTRIVINECHTVLRKRKRLVPTEDMGVYEVHQQPPDIALRDALDRLNEQQRLPLLLHYMEGFSEQEVAKALRLPVTTVKGRMHRGREALRKQLSEQEVCVQ